MGPWSVDSSDGGATDVSILGLMEIKNYIIVFIPPTADAGGKRAREKSAIQ